MNQLDDLAVNGEIHHYKIDTALFLLAFHADGLTDVHKGNITALRAQIGAKPDKPTSAKIATSSLALLNDLRRQLQGPTYSAIFGQLQDALTRDLTAGTTPPTH